MSFGTSIPFLMRKKNMSHMEAKRVIEDLVNKGILREPVTELDEHEEESFSLTFLAESKYGRHLFYPICDNSQFIICNLLSQKTATKKQIILMQEQGWMVKLKQKEIF